MCKSPPNGRYAFTAGLIHKIVICTNLILILLIFLIIGFIQYFMIFKNVNMVKANFTVVQDHTDVLVVVAVICRPWNSKWIKWKILNITYSSRASISNFCYSFCFAISLCLVQRNRNTSSVTHLLLHRAQNCPSCLGIVLPLQNKEKQRWSTHWIMTTHLSVQ